MKKNTTPELSAKWWNSNAPDGLSATKELEKALVDYESAEAKLKKDGSESNVDACLKSLAQVETAAKKNKAEAEKLAKTPPKKTKSTAEDYQNTAECLKKVPRIADAARKELEDNAKASVSEDEEDDAGAGLLTNEKDYQVYLKKTLNKLKQRSMNFAVGLGKKPNEHRYLFHKSKPGKSLIAAVKEGTDLKKFTWGIAGGHEEKPTTLVLALEGPLAPGLKKKTEKLFKHFKPLPFNLVMLMVEGEEADDIEDPEDVDDEATASTVPPPKSEQPVDPGAAFKARLSALLPTIQKAIAEKQPEGEIAKLKASEAGVFARKKEFGPANQRLDEIDALLLKLTGAPPAPSSSDDLTRIFTARLKAVKPAVDTLTAAQTPLGEEGKLRMSEAAALARQGAFGEALRVLDAVEKLVAKPDAGTGAGPDDFRAVWAEASTAWKDASDRVDGQIAALQVVLKNSADGELARIAEFGLNAVTANHKVPLLATLRDIEDAGANIPPAVLAKANQRVADFLAHIETDKRVFACDRNPFGVTVTIRRTLGDALVALQQALHGLGSR